MMTKICPHTTPGKRLKTDSVKVPTTKVAQTHTHAYKVRNLTIDAAADGKQTFYFRASGKLRVVSVLIGWLIFHPGAS